jgi:crossover junction endodeoxyribonuclease RusA
MKTIILHGEPKSTSHIYKITSRGRFASMYMSKEGKLIKDSYIKQGTLQWANKPLIGDIRIYIELYFGTKRKVDIDNFGKLLLDSLTGIVWIDDSQIVDMRIIKKYDKNKGRIEIDVDVI